MGNQAGASFRLTDNRLWVFVDGTGLISLNPEEPENYKIEMKTLRISLEGLAWNQDGSLLYASQDKNLYTFIPQTSRLNLVCKNKLPGITKALEWGPDGLTGAYTHGEESCIYTFDPTTCSVTNTVLYAVPYNDVESLVFP